MHAGVSTMIGLDIKKLVEGVKGPAQEGKLIHIETGSVQYLVITQQISH